MHAWWGRTVAVAFATLACVASNGCGDERPPSAEAQRFTPPAGAGGASFGGGDGGSPPPGCGQKDDGSYCECLDVPLFTDPPNLYFVLDRSGSMSEGGKWDRIRVTLGQLLRGLGPRVNVAAAMFPGASESCAPGREVMPLRPGDPPSSTTDGPSTKLLLDVTRVVPSGGTPTAASLVNLFGTVSALPGKTFVILATDGAPNCNANASCTLDKCIPNVEDAPQCPRVGPTCCEPPVGARENCLDEIATTQAVSQYAGAGIPVFVVGIPGSAPYAALLDQLAQLGGTALPGTPRYYRVDGSSGEELLGALRKVAAKIVATCELPLAKVPEQPDNVNVYLDDVVLPQDPANGWKLEGAKVTLLGSSCERVLAGDVLSVRVIVGCPTIKPN